MTWSGGNCPKCGEFMPLGVFRCRYCHTALDGSEGAGEIDAAPVAMQADGDDVVSTPAVSTLAVAAEMAQCRVDRDSSAAPGKLRHQFEIVPLGMGCVFQVGGTH